MNISSNKYKKMFISKPLLKILSIILFFQVFVISLPGETADSNDDNEKSQPSLDLLIAPSSPAFALLGGEPASIIRPETGTDLAVTILKQTDNLSTIPEDFAIEFLPAWIFNGKNITFDSLKNNKNPLKILWQTLSISIATKSNATDDNNSSSSGKNVSENSDSENDSRSLSLGIRFSLIRGKLLYEDKYYKIKKAIEDMNLTFVEKLENDLLYRQLQDERRTPGLKDAERDKIIERMEKRANELEKELYFEAASEPFSFKRTGWDLNIAGGVVYNFPGNKFENGKLDKWGLWTTLSYEMKKVNLLAVGRYLSMEEDEDSIKKHCFDIGYRIIFDSFKNYSLSGELLFRKYNKNENETDTSQWRAALLFEFKIGKNQSINVTLGRDFEGNEKGNFISMVGLTLGVGSKRPIL